MTNNIKLVENIDLDKFKNNLKVARESKKKTIEQSSKLLHIDINILKKLENGEFNKLTNDVFIKGHIRTYLKWLEIDPSLLIEDHKNTEDIKLVIKNPKINAPYKLRISKIHVSFISLTFFILIILLYNNINKEDSVIDINTINTQGTPIKNKVQNFELEKLPDVMNIDKLASNKEIKNTDITKNMTEENNYLYIKAIEDTWVEIQRNNLEVLITKVIKKNEELKILYEKNLILVTGNAGGIIIHINGKTINNIGMPGEVKRNISLNYDDLLNFK